MANTVPPMPYKVPVTDGRGIISEPWSKWLLEVFTRIGGTSALSNTELAEASAVDVSALQADIDAMDVIVTSHTSTLSSHTTSISTFNTSVNDLQQGRQV